MISVSSRDRAEKSLVTHSFRPGQGYIDHGTEMPISGIPKAPESVCLPADDAADGSAHYLAPAGTEARIRMTWVKAEKLWAAFGGRRMAFRASYLAHHGWKYIGPV